MKRRNRRKSVKITKALLTAAASFNGLATSPIVFAESQPIKNELRFGFFSYEDWQSSEDRMRIYSPMIWIKSPVAERASLEAGFVLDTTSGASPIYHDTLSGASGKGIKDRRSAGDLTFTQSFENFSLSASISNSNEDDYDSLGGGIEARFWTEDQNTIFNIGISGSSDDISSTNDPLLDKHKTSKGAGFGVTQIINQNSLIQSNLTYSGSNGFLSDPYKSLDLRPNTRDSGAWLTRYIYYFEESEAALHLDYRWFRDSWNISAHTAEITWHQQLGNSWMISPHFRYYTQNKSNFYNNSFPPDSPGESFYTSDQRLSGFGSITAGFSVSHDIAENFAVSGYFDYMRQNSGWKLFSPGSPNISSLNGLILGAGLTYRF